MSWFGNSDDGIVREHRERTGHGAHNLPADQARRFQRNVALAVRAFGKDGIKVVPAKPLETGSGWQCQPLEIFDGRNNIERSFAIWAQAMPVPSFARQILPGSHLPDGTVFGQAAAPVAQSNKRAALLARAKKAISEGVPLAAVRSLFNNKFGIDIKEEDFYS